MFYENEMFTTLLILALVFISYALGYYAIHKHKIKPVVDAYVKLAHSNVRFLDFLTAYSLSGNESISVDDACRLYDLAYGCKISSSNTKTTKPEKLQEHITEYLDGNDNHIMTFIRFDNNEERMTLAYFHEDMAILTSITPDLKFATTVYGKEDKHYEGVCQILKDNPPHAKYTLLPNYDIPIINVGPNGGDSNEV